MASLAELQLDLGFADGDGDGDWFDALVAINQRWLGSYARLNPSFGVSPALLERNSLWMNTHFQRQRMITSPLSKQAKTLLTQHQQTVLARLRAGGGPQHSEAEWSTALVEPLAALMFAASVDRCPEYQIESLLMEAHELLQSQALRANALRSGFAGCVFRFLTTYTEARKRILALELLLLLATDDAAAVVRSCKIAAQGQLWQPNMFIYTLQKRHHDNATICDLASQLLAWFAEEMPVTSPVKIDSGRYESQDDTDGSPGGWAQRPIRSDPCPSAKTHTLPALKSPSLITGATSPHRPTTTISTLYVGSPSPYSSNVVLPIARPPPSAVEQARRAQIYSTPKERAVAGDRKRRCLTPNIQEIKREPSVSDDLGWMDSSGSPPRSPSSPRTEKKQIALSEKYSWNPDCINSVSGFEWWWRSLPQHHSNLEPTQKLKMVTKAAVRLHTKGEWERAVELYLLALSMDINEEVAFRLRVNLGCAYEAGREFRASEAEFRSALRINPDDPYARFKLGSALKELGKLDEAAAAFKAVVGAYPQAEDALRQLEEVRFQKIKQEEDERAALVAARTARSPAKTGRKLHSRGNSQGSSLPRIPTSSSPTSPRSQRPSATARSTDCANGSSSTTPMDLLSCIHTRSCQKRVDLRSAFRNIDTASTGRMRLPALAKLIAALCDVDDEVFYSWLPHDSVSVDERGSVRYDTLLEALEEDAKDRHEREPDYAHHWASLVEAIRLEEAVHYGKENVEQRPEDPPVEDDGAALPVDEASLPSGAVRADEKPTGAVDSEDEDETPAINAATRSDGPKEDDLQVETPSFEPPARRVRASGSVPLLSLELPARPAAVEELGGYHSMSARVDEKREKARQETILRAERSRVVARKHLHCLKALQDIAARARQHLEEQYAARQEATGVALDSAAEPQTPTRAVDEGGVGGSKPVEASEPPPAAGSESEPAAAALTDALTARQGGRNGPTHEHEYHGGEQAQTREREPESDGSASMVVAVLCQRTVDEAIAAATRAVAVAARVEELRALAAAVSAACCVIPTQWRA